MKICCSKASSIKTDVFQQNNKVARSKHYWSTSNCCVFYRFSHIFQTSDSCDHDVSKVPDELPDQTRGEECETREHQQTRHGLFPGTNTGLLLVNALNTVLLLVNTCLTWVIFSYFFPLLD